MMLAPHRAVVAFVAAAVVVGAVPGVAEARVRKTCAPRTRVMSTPGGLVVGFLTRGTPVIVLKRTRNGYWTEVRAVQSIVGWIHSEDLC
jgi:Bacterial SH3 domain